MFFVYIMEKHHNPEADFELFGRYEVRLDKLPYSFFSFLHGSLQFAAKDITYSPVVDTKFYEETMLQGMVIGLAKMELDERMKFLILGIYQILQFFSNVFCCSHFV